MSLEFTGKIKKIESGEVRGISNVIITSDDEKIITHLEILDNLIDLQEDLPVDLKISVNDVEGDFDLLLKGRIYTVSTDKTGKQFIVSFGGLRAKIMDLDKKAEFPPKADLYFGLKKRK
ncbi:MAG: hypothetical protein ACTSSJ_03160 [Candidatus Odinarchaeia archaeon]